MMKLFSTAIVCVLLCMLWNSVKAQNPLCSKFCISDVRQDTFQPDQLLFSIYFDEDPNVFINYPYIVLAVDHEGDSLAQGFLFFFGQFGGTTTEYPATIIPSQLPEPLEGSLLFAYDTNFCQLDFPCLGSASEDLSSYPSLDIVPNPASETVVVSSPMMRADATVFVHDMNGRQVMQKSVSEDGSATLAVSDLASGVYVVRISQDGIRFAPQKICIHHP